MGYVVVTGNTTSGRYYLTDTCNKPRIAVKVNNSTSYIPMKTTTSTITTGTRIGNTILPYSCYNISQNIYSSCYYELKSTTASSKYVSTKIKTYYFSGFSPRNLVYEDTSSYLQYTTSSSSTTSGLTFYVRGAVSTPYETAYFGEISSLSKKFTLKNADLRFCITEVSTGDWFNCDSVITNSMAHPWYTTNPYPPTAYFTISYVSLLAAHVSITDGITVTSAFSCFKSVIPYYDTITNFYNGNPHHYHSISVSVNMTNSTQMSRFLYTSKYKVSTYSKKTNEMYLYDLSKRYTITVTTWI